jgi:multidrug efflux pump subunit AcrA (membrane-fusion protein)
MKRFVRSRWGILALVAIVVATGAVALSARGAGTEGNHLVARVTRGDFKVQVNSSGELRATSSGSVAPPQNGCMVNACSAKILSIVPEGTVVKMGDTVAELDRSPITTSRNNYNISLQKAQAVFEQAQLDTTLNLSKAREEIRIATVALEERKIAKEQAAFEAPSVKRQADIDYDKAERALEQGKKDYVTRENQAKAKMREVNAEVQRNQNYLQMVNDVASQFTVTAPAPGMVIYTKDYQGKKRGAGSIVNSYEGAMALLPDLTHMESITYINEVDVRKVSVGQKVIMSLDSDPSKKLTGTVSAVANMGDERPNSDAKVFEVRIDVAESDTALRPGMTTSNAIAVMEVRNVLSVPLEAITSEANVPYVFKQVDGAIIKQEVVTGAMNDSHVIITRGLDENDSVLLLPPADLSKIETRRLDGNPNAVPSAAKDAPAAKSVPAGGDRKAPGKGAVPESASKCPAAKQSGRQ